MFEVSVIICTHNPRPDYLRRTLDALKVQTLSKDQWELLLIDDASKEPLAKNWDLSWYPHARHIREDELGLTPARLRGIRESKGELLVFVDDDNVLAADYLERAAEIAVTHPFVGVWGGVIRGEFEMPPDPKIKKYLQHLAIREVPTDAWANFTSGGEAEPCGAGMCVRRAVALRYAKDLEDNPRRKLLDRKGNSLSSGGDIDLAYTACDVGLAMGQFSRLQVLHLIPKRRLEEQYILKLIEGVHQSEHTRKFLKDGRLPDHVERTGPKEWLRFLYHSLHLRGFERRAYLAKQRSIRWARNNLKA